MYTQHTVRCFSLDLWPNAVYYRFHICKGALNFCLKYGTPQEAWDAIETIDWFDTVDDRLSIFTRQSALLVWRDFLREIAPEIYTLFCDSQIVRIINSLDKPITSHTLNDLYRLSLDAQVMAIGDYKKIVARSVSELVAPDINRKFGQHCVRAIYDLIWLHHMLVGPTAHYQKRREIDQLAVNIIRRHHPIVPVVIEYFE